MLQLQLYLDLCFLMRKGPAIALSTLFSEDGQVYLRIVYSRSEHRHKQRIDGYDMHASSAAT